MDISLFVRTREPGGLIFYLGTPPADSGGPSYVAAELQNGRLLVVVDLGDGELLFPATNSPPLNDGNSHLVQVNFLVYSFFLSIQSLFPGLFMRLNS